MCSWLTFALPQLGAEDGDAISQILLYLAEYAYRGTRHTRADVQLLDRVLEQLSRFYFTNEPLLSAITGQLATSMVSKSSRVIHGKRFRLLSDRAAHLYLAIPEDQRPRSPLFQSICRQLGHCLDRLLNTPFSEAASIIPSTIFEQPHWLSVYESLDSTNRLKLLNCVMNWYADKTCDQQERFKARYQFQLGLGWLTALAQTPNAKDLVIHTWMDFLLYVLDEKNQLLTIESHRSAADHGELDRAIQTLRHDLPGMERFLKKADSLRTAELVLLVQYSTDETLRNVFLEKIEKRLPMGEEEMDVFNWDMVVSHVLEQEIQPLYPACEARLREHLEWGERHKYKRPVFDRDFRQLSYLWLLQGEYGRVLADGHPYVQAVALLEGPAKDLAKAATSWEALVKETREPGAYINWLLAYTRQLEEAPMGKPSCRKKIYQKIEAVRQSVETGPFQSWEKEEQLHYADVLASILAGCGGQELDSTADQYVGQRLTVSIDPDRTQWPSDSSLPVVQPHTNDVQIIP